MVSTVNEEMSRRVWKAVRELNYYPNTQARSLVSGRSKLFGLIISEITNPFFPELIQGFEDIAVENGYEIMVGSTNYDPKRMALCIRRMLERGVDGVAVMTFGIEEPILDEFATRNIPLVLVDTLPVGPLIKTLSVDYRHGIRQAVQHLAVLGHRRIGFVSGPLRLRSSQLRKAAFVASMEEIGSTPSAACLIEGDHTLEGGVRAAEQLLRLRQVPTAVMCSNDMTAIGVLKQVRRAGLSVPTDLSVIGFDDIHMTEFVYPPLTTVQMSRTDLARAAFDVLRNCVEHPKDAAKPELLKVPTSLTVRQSTGFPRGFKFPVRSGTKKLPRNGLKNG
jgi:LacI family transcriptional regulator